MKHIKRQNCIPEFIAIVHHTIDKIIRGLQGDNVIVARKNMKIASTATNIKT
jgi:hypothetical protein